MFWQQLLKQPLALNCANCEGNVRKHSCHCHRNMQQGQGSLTICWKAWIILHPLSSFTKHGLHVYTLPPPLSSSDWAYLVCQKKPEADLLDGEEGFKSLPSMGTHGQGWAAIVHNTSYLPKWVAMIVLVLWHGRLASRWQVINTTGLRWLHIP